MSDELEREIRARAALYVVKPLKQWPPTMLTTEDFLASIQREAIAGYRDLMRAAIEAEAARQITALEEPCRRHDSCGDDVPCMAALRGIQAEMDIRLDVFLLPEAKP